MHRKWTLWVTCVLALFCTTVSAQSDLVGVWDGELKSPGGPLPFGLKFATNREGFVNAYLLNGPETIKIPVIKILDDQLYLIIDHYDSELQLTVPKDRKSLKGVWRKTRGKDNVSTMEVQFLPHKDRAKESVGAFIGKWAVDFSSSDDPAIAVIRPDLDHPGRCYGTFRTTTGDYRYLGGTVEDGQLRLSVFDGGHAFLFLAKLNAKGELQGDFWSSLNWHETWTAVRSDDAEMPDAFEETRWLADAELGDFKFPNLEGVPTSLNDPAFTGRPRLIHVFGSWCPNCHDAGVYLGQLQEKYGDDLSILGLAFELTGDFQRDAAQVKIFHDRHETDYPVLIAGLADKDLATKSIPFLDRVRSYPTTIFLNASGDVVGIHTGFNGPATADAYEALQKEFESRIEAMIADWKSKKR